MIHVITSIYGRNDWAYIQDKYIRKYTSDLSNINILCGHMNCELFQSDIYNFVDLAGTPNQHYLQMNIMADNLCQNNEVNDDDIILFLDIDAFPCEYNWDKKLEAYLVNFDVACVVMKENKGMDPSYDDMPHLCFFATKVKTWKANNMKWDLAGSHNPQYGMKACIANNQLKLKELLRTNKFDVGRVCYGIYDNLVYHQACGIRGFERKVFEGADLYDRYPGYYPGDFKNATNDISQLDAEIWLRVFDAIKDDCNNGECNFVRRYFMGVK